MAETLNHIDRIANIYKVNLEDAEFIRLSDFIYKELGIKMPEVKRSMLQGRLQKRLSDLQKNNFKEYVDFVFSKNGRTELVNMVDIVTTNKTDFFREQAHFEYLSKYVLPELTEQSGKQNIRIWSAGCSSGEEPYTLAIVLSEFRENFGNFDFHITGSDISTRMLAKGSEAIYAEEKVADIPLSLKKKYLLRSKDEKKKTVRIVPELRCKVNFTRINFMDDVYQVNGLFDIIFCRNMLIYFDRKTQENVINKLCTKLKQGGYFFLGHSESISNYNVPLKQIQSTIFTRK
jgi:chemotaxis protein methyltransferase CheR